MYKADKLYDEMKALEKQIKAIDVTNADIDEATIVEYFRLYTLLIYNYKWVGSIYDIYAGDVVVRREDGLMLSGAAEVRADVMQLLAAFPDLELSFTDIFTVKTDDGFKLWRHFNLDGTNLGYSKYGPPTGRQLEGKKALGLAMSTVQYKDGKWRIQYENMSLAGAWIYSVCN